MVAAMIVRDGIFLGDFPSRGKGFPYLAKRICVNKIYDGRDVLAFVSTREKRKTSLSSKKP